MGVPFEEHGVFWYGDPKPARYPLYWQAVAAAGRSTGVVGTLHSSPLGDQCDFEAMEFAIPDAFAESPESVPGRLHSLQEFNLAMTRRNSRAVADTAPWRQYLSAVGALARNGLAPGTGVELGRLAAGVAAGRTVKERLRVGQFHLMADQFSRLARRHDPDLAVFFSNHVASAMHRYWYTIFPEDWNEEIYDREWVARFSGEIPYAMRSLDTWLERWMRWVEDSDRTLLILSSMGQHGGSPVDTSVDETLVVDDPRRFASVLGLPDRFTVGNAMVPQITYRFVSSDDAGRAGQRLRDLRSDRLVLSVDRHGNAVTITYETLPGDGAKVEIDGRIHHLAEAGLKSIEVSEHRAATHHPLGSVIVYNSPTGRVPDRPFNYLGVAPAILESLDVDPLAHHRCAGFGL